MQYYPAGATVSQQFQPLHSIAETRGADSQAGGLAARPREIVWSEAEGRLLDIDVELGASPNRQTDVAGYNGP